MLIIRMGRRLVNHLIGYYLPFKIQIDSKNELLGTDYGGYCICSESIKKESIIYSIGIGDDISFDLEMIKKYNVKIYAFDPTPKSINWVRSQDLPKEFIFFPFGVADYDGIANFLPPKNPQHISYRMTNDEISSSITIKAEVYRLSTIMSKLGHKKIEVLKIDIEGAEYSVINDIIASNIKVHQLLVEFHHRFRNIGLSKTKKVIELLNENGFKIFYVSPSQEVYSFIKNQ